jgi:NAD(P)-dependent dehydrogenase (short-subunit alcohol dehydrogenase family)
LERDLTDTPTLNAGSIAVVTGGSSGMGLACAYRLGRRHALVLADINRTGLEAATAELRAAGCSVTPIAVDITQPDSVSNLAETTRSLGRFDVLVHAAGLSPNMAGGRRILEVNLVGTALVERAFLPLAGAHTAAVLIASTAGHMGSFAERNEAALRNPLGKDFWAHVAQALESPESAYSLSKRGVILYCEAVAPEWGARGARITTVSPGMIKTPMGELEFANQPLMKNMLEMTPIQRWGGADEIAAAVEFLVSEGASFITGTDLRVDGGITPRFKNLAR